MEGKADPKVDGQTKSPSAFGIVTPGRGDRCRKGEDSWANYSSGEETDHKEVKKSFECQVAQKVGGQDGHEGFEGPGSFHKKGKAKQLEHINCFTNAVTYHQRVFRGSPMKSHAALFW